MPALPRILITAGPTREPIDAVRYVSNRSSGRLGLAIAHATAERGVPTTLLLGPIDGPADCSSHIGLRRFQSTADLQTQLHLHWPEHDLLIMAAAVADYRPVNPSTGKMRRVGSPCRIELEPTPDLLAEAASNARPEQRLVGFALEPTDRLAESASTKLHRKGVHAIVANPLETMDSPDIAATIYSSQVEPIATPARLSKAEFADWLLDQLAGLFNLNIPLRM